MPRRPTIFKGSDGLFHCYVTVGTGDNGRPKRRNVSGKTQTIVSDKVSEIERRRDGGERLVSKSPTVAEWLDYYLEHVIRPARKPKTFEAYRPIIQQHLNPYIGRYRLAGSRSVLTPDHVEHCYNKLSETLAPSYVLQCHRVLSRALKVAVRRGRATQNVCNLIDGPSVRRRRPHPMNVKDLRKVVAAIDSDRQRARWLIALLLGMRQGEVLGLRWSLVDLDGETPRLLLEKQAQRQKWQHGCRDERACAAPHCRRKPCNPRGGVCRVHKRPASCKKLCPANCTGHAAACKQRVGGGIVDVDLKSERSERPIPLPPMIVDALRVHRRRQAEERLAAATWPHGDLVFLNPDGTRIDPTRDHEAWEAVLRSAGVADMPLHAARHTAATQLLANGADLSTVQELLGHSDIRVTRGYADVAQEAKREALTRASDALVQQSRATVGRR